METTTIIFICCVLVAIFVGYLFFYYKDKDKLGKMMTAQEREANKELLPLRLQAYERLVLLTDRIALPNLISRVNMRGLSAKEMQYMLLQTIKQEFEHNVTQQIYVNPHAWEALCNLKEQNMLIINQVGSFLPETASGSDLNKALLELLVQNPMASLHSIVSEALSFEAKKLLK